MNPNRFLLIAIICEQWLRYAWLNEDLCIRVPDDAAQKLTTQFPELVPLLNRLNGATITDGEASTLAVMDLAESVLGRQALPAILDDPDFQEDVRCFQAWVQAESAHTTCPYEDFGAWAAAFIATREKQ